MSPVGATMEEARVDVLDHGYVELVEWWGSDERIVEAARMSTNKGFQGWGDESTWRCDQCGYEMVVPHNDKARLTEHAPLQKYVMMPGPNEPPSYTRPAVHAMTYVSGRNGDEKLLRYLWTHRHTTPFEMAGLTIEVQAPIFVFREWHRHRTQSYNEMSARYTPLPDVNYIPNVQRLLMTSDKNKQAQGVSQLALTPELAREFQTALEAEYKAQQGLYELALARGVPKELARLVLPVGRYSRMRASTDLWNWLHFMRLRMDETAQWEIRQYANVVAGMIEVLFPRTYVLFKESIQR